MGWLDKLKKSISSKSKDDKKKKSPTPNKALPQNRDKVANIKSDPRKEAKKQTEKESVNKQPTMTLNTGKKIFEGTAKDKAKNLGVQDRSSGSKYANTQKAKAKETLKTNTKGDSVSQKYWANSAKNITKKADEAYKRGDTAQGNKLMSEADKYTERYNKSKATQNKGYEQLTGSEALALQNATRGKAPETTRKELTALQQTYAQGDKDKEYGDIRGKLARNYKYDVDVNPLAQGFISGVNWVPVKSIVKQTSGVDDLNLEGDKTGLYNVGEMAGFTAGAMATGAGIGKAMEGSGRVGKILANIGADLPSNMVQAKISADESKERGLTVPDDIKFSTKDKSTDKEISNNPYITEGVEPSSNPDDAGVIPHSIDKWNEDIVEQAKRRGEKKGKEPIWGKDKNGRLHYAWDKDDLDDILTYYNNAENPTYTLRGVNKGDKARSYSDSDALRLGKEMAINTAISGVAGGVLGGARKETSYIKSNTVSKEHKGLYNEYIKSKDDSIATFINKVRNGEVSKKAFKKLGKTKEGEVAELKGLTGVDTTDYTRVLSANQVAHIDKRHGAHGLQDASMSYDDDLSRMKYVLENPDKIELLKDKKGNIVKSSAFYNDKGEKALQAKYSKQVDGHYYVVTAVLDSKKKHLNVVSAYIEKADPKSTLKEVPAAVNATTKKSSPQLTSETPSEHILDSNISKDTPDVNLPKAKDHKEQQLEIIKKTNPMQDDYHVGVREKDDIKTWEEVLKDDDEIEGQFAWGDYTREEAEQALKDGKITVYSSKPIEDGAFVSTSRVQAEDYAGGAGGKVYEKEVPLDEVAWINGDEGQYAKVAQTEPKNTEVPKKENKLPNAVGSDANRHPNTVKESTAMQNDKLPEGEKYKYETESHAQRNESAEQRVQADAKGEFKELTNKEDFTSEDFATTKKLYDKSFKEGNMADANKIAYETAKHASKKGQELEAVKHWKDDTPEGMVLKGQKNAVKAENELKKKNSKVFEKAEKEAEAVKETVNKAQDDTLKKVVENMTDALKKKGVKTKTKEPNLVTKYEKSSSGKVAKNLETPTDKATPPMQEAFDNMVKEFSSYIDKGVKADSTSKVDDFLKSVASRTDNAENWQRVYQGAKQEILAKYKNDKEALARAKEFFKQADKSFDEKLMNKAFDESMKNIGETVSTLLKKNSHDKAKALEEIKKALTNGVADKDVADDIAKAVETHFDDLINEKKLNAFNDLIFPKNVKDKLQRSAFDKVTERANTLDDLADDYFKSAHATKDVDNVLRETMKDLEVNLRDIVKQSSGTKESIGENIESYVRGVLEKKFVDEKTAGIIAKQARETYEKNIQETARKYLLNRFSQKATTKGQKSMFDSVMELINMGAYSDDEVVTLMKQRNNIPVLTTKQAQEVSDLMKQSNEATDEYAKKMLKARAEQIVSDVDPVTWIEKYRAFQRISMLLNPKTLITRNPLGNVMFDTADLVKDVPASVFDRLIALKTGERTTQGITVAKLNATAEGMKKGLKEQAKDIKYGVDTSPTRGQAELPSKTIFRHSKVLNGLDKTTSKALQFGDRPFYEGAYQMRKAELEDLIKKGKHAPMTEKEMHEELREYALDKVFQNHSRLADSASDLREGANKLTGGVGGYVISPFVQTPSNILDKVLDYSPVGFAKALAEASKLGKGVGSQKKLADLLGRAFTGTGLMALGYKMMQDGLIQTETYDKEKFDEYKNVTNQGVQANSIKFGDTYYSIDWATVSGQLLLMGAEFANNGEDEKKFSTMLLDSGKRGLDSFFSNSFVQNFSDLFSKGSVSEGLIQTAKDLPLQMVPQGLASVNRIIDPYKRETYDESELKSLYNQAISKIPFLSQTLPEKRNVTGGKVKQYQGRDAFQKSLESLLLPWNRSDDRGEGTQKEVLKVYNETGDSTVLFNSAEKKFTYHNKKYTIDNGKDYTQFQRTAGKYAVEQIKSLMKQKGYEDLSSTEKAEKIADIQRSALNKAREEYLINSGKMTEREIAMASLPKKSSARISALMKDGASEKDLKKQGYDTNIKYTKTGKIKETAYSRAEHFNSMGDYDYVKAYNEIKNTKKAKKYDANGDGKLSTADEVKKYIDSEHPNWSANKKWAYLYGTTSVSRSSRSKYGY